MNSSNPDTTKNTRKPFRLSWRDLSLRTKLIVALMAVALVPLLIISVVNDRNTRSALIEDANTNLLGSGIVAMWFCEPRSWTRVLSS